ncbi:MAG: collagen-like protein [Carboxylicivirga sp.]|jgi:hypothetical protein|nr:collagen-like protein [Carboxylicivirga sp.]
MKKLKQITGLIVVAMAVVFAGCTKEGPQGPPGSDGSDGTDGTNGSDGTAGCITCHTNDSELTIKTAQFEHSIHFTGGAEHTGYANYAGGSCSMCHSHNGFMKAVEDGTNFGGLHAEAAAMSCYTCHQIHTSYTRDDYAMVYEGEVDLIMNEVDAFSDLSVDAGEPSNTCVKCHQARNRGDDTPNLDVSTNTLITSSHYGPHYGVQGIIYGGKGGYFASEADKGKHNCVKCHMSNAASTGNYGAYFGGHSMALSMAQYDDETGEMTSYTAFTKACTDCHESLDDDFDLNGIQTGVKAKLAALKTALMENNIMDDHDHIITDKEYTQEQLAAFWNYKLVKDDGSYGIHNKVYANDLLDGALSALQD